MDITEKIGHKSSSQYTKDYSDGYTVTDGSPLREPFWYDHVNPSKEELLCGGNIMKMYNHDWKIEAHKVNPGKKNIEESTPPVLATLNPQAAMAFTDVISKESYPEMYGYGQMNMSSKQTKPANCECFDDSGITEGDHVIGVEVEVESSSPVSQEYPWDSSENPGDAECSASDILDDETFLSVKSGSIYSRSSSPYSFDDTECIFEEALEDLSSLSLCSQVNPSHDVLCSTDAGPQSATTNQSSNVLQTINGKSHIERKCKLRNTSCNTDLSWVSRNDKLTQTINIATQETAVNADQMMDELFSQDEKTVQMETGVCKDTERFKENSDTLSESKEVFLQRAIKAELQLVDVQRWLCLQLCWKTQQQSMEKLSFFGLHKSPTDHSTGGGDFSLLSALAEVEEKYQEMKKQVQAGVPLETLIPLNMQLTKVETPANDLLKECFTDTSQHRTMQKGSDPLEGIKKTTSVKMDSTSKIIPVAQNEEQKVGKTCQSEKVTEVQPRFYVHVGSIAPGVKEVELLNAFKKYNVLNIYIEKSSLTSSYAVLIFNCLEQAETAVKEMNGKEFWGKKLKVRSIRNTDSDFTPVFATALPQDQVKIGTKEPNACFASQSPSSSKPKLVPHGNIPKVQSDEGMKSPFVNTLKNVLSPYNKGNQAFPSEQYSSMPSFKTCIPSGHHWMSLQSNMMSYSSIASPLFIPYSYPPGKLPSYSPFPMSVPVSNSSTYFPFINMQSNANYVGKESSSGKPAMPVNPVYTTNNPTSCGVKSSNVKESVQHNTTISTARTWIAGSNTSPENKMNKPTSAQSVREPSSVSAKDNCKPKETVSVPSTPNTVYKAATDSFPSAAPLRVPTYVPPNVTIPKANESSSDTMSSAGALSYSTDKEHASPSDSSHQKGSLPSAEMDWGVYPQLDTSTEHPIIVIPNQLNFSQFKKVLSFLQERHKNVTRDQIIETLRDIRKNRGGSLAGMGIPEIVFEASSILTTIKY